MPNIQRLRQEDYQFQANWSYRTSSRPNLVNIASLSKK
jgi:hypothetical protein